MQDKSSFPWARQDLHKPEVMFLKSGTAHTSQSSAASSLRLEAAFFRPNTDYKDRLGAIYTNQALPS